MCIALISTAHPSYPLILIDNRDEFLHRPTARASWWAEDPNILSARDLARPAHGTWLGVTRRGRIAVLTNFREHTQGKGPTTADNTPKGTPGKAKQAPDANLNANAGIVGRISRGEIVSKYLRMPPDSTTEEYARELKGREGPVVGGEAGGFTVACGDVRGPLAVLSNRGDKRKGGRGSKVNGCGRHEEMDEEGDEDITYIGTAPNQTFGLSNLAFGDRSWPKIARGEALLRSAIDASVREGESEDELIQRLVGVLSVDTLPRIRADKEGDDGRAETYFDLLKESIFIPAIGAGEEGRDLETEALSRQNGKTQAQGEEGVEDGKGEGEDDQASICSSDIHASASVVDSATQNGNGVGADRKENVVPPSSTRVNGDSREKQKPPAPYVPCLHGLYGTQTQTVVLVHESGKVTYFERTLYDREARGIPVPEGDQVFRFEVERD